MISAGYLYWLILENPPNLIAFLHLVPSVSVQSKLAEFLLGQLTGSMNYTIVYPYSQCFLQTQILIFLQYRQAETFPNLQILVSSCLTIPSSIYLSFLTFYYEQTEKTGFRGSSVGKEYTCNAGDLGSIPRLGRSPGRGHGNPLQYSCLKNSTNRGAWQPMAHGVAKNWAQLSD